MYICICRGITDSQLKAVSKTCSSFEELKEKTGVSKDCGRCEATAMALYEESTEGVTPFAVGLGFPITN